MKTVIKISYDNNQMITHELKGALNPLKGFYKIGSKHLNSLQYTKPNQKEFTRVVGFNIYYK